tara:strand:+ start:109 stop:564 length:456 start_codon:yes stop_codon:yes gene_type:complete
MNIKNKFIVCFIFFTILTLSIFNTKNPEKTKFYLFTSKIEDLSLGNLITITFISGFTFSSLLTLISKNKSQELLEDNFINNDEEIYKSDKNNFIEELEYDRPPERDVRESQPTISVNYRFIDQDNNYSSSNKTKNNLNEEENDWLNNDNEW